MANPKWIFVCQSCGQRYSKWAGQCKECNEWNTIIEEREAPTKSRALAITESAPPRPISEIAAETLLRWPIEMSELDNVLGGGLVPGSVVLLGGEPGIGKSTILIQVAECLAKQKKTTLYVSGEESVSQIALRSSRLGLGHPNCLVVSETVLENVISHVEKLSPQILILDSIQTLYASSLDSQPGSVGQLRECTYQIISLAKNRGIATFLVGHVTKEGAIAGPKVLEHMVDVVLYFETTASQSFRLLRSIKNRFGSTNEVGVFEMGSKGLTSVNNPSELFLSERSHSISGSVVTASLEGTRPLLVEVQALVSSTSLAIPRRTAIGIDSNRVALLVAILEKRGGYRLYDQDVYVNIAGGLRLTEPAADLAVVASLLSSLSNRPIERETVFFGEVGLGGEIRSVPRTDARLKEAERIGMKRAFVPKRHLKGIETVLELQPLEHVGELSDLIV